MFDANTPPSASIGSASRVTGGLQVAPLEHRLDDQVAALQVGDVGGRGHALQQGIALRVG